MVESISAEPLYRVPTVNCRFTGCKDNTERSCIPFSYFPPMSSLNVILGQYPNLDTNFGTTVVNNPNVILSHIKSPRTDIIIQT
jgi:hypothetical protein